MFVKNFGGLRGVGFLFGCAVWGLLSGLTGCDAVRFGLGVLLWLCWFVALIGLFTCAFRFLLLFFWGFYYFVSVVVVTSDFGVLSAMWVT